ncbi:hypothetical protein ACFXD5_22685 [Streptomyces sp. NPDC059385]|uniref:hypothetical protein n=1 Tax=Streptomyces sp. NPDC059385 TaxID=3346817 RepID=UPI00368C2233
MSQAPDRERDRHEEEELSWLGFTYLWAAAKDYMGGAIVAALAASALAAVCGMDTEDPTELAMFAGLTLTFVGIGLLMSWSGSPSRRLRRVRRFATSRTPAARHIRAHLLGRTKKTSTEIRGSSVYLTRELRTELKAKGWLHTGTRTDAVLKAASANASLTPLPGMRWCEAKTFTADDAGLGVPLLCLRWSIADHKDVVIIGHA